MDRRRFVGSCLGFGIAAPLFKSARIQDFSKGGADLLELTGEGLQRIRGDITLPGLADHLFKQFNDHSNRSWAELFSPEDRVGIKVSCLPGRPLSTSVYLVKSLVDCLKRVGIKSNRIVVWERTIKELKKAGFTSRSVGCRVTGTDELPGGGYAPEVSIHRSIGTCFSRIFDQIDSLISAPILKDHDLSGISAGMKNFYGAIHNPNKFHGDNCDPYIADLCSHPLIREKLKLVVCDASRIQFQGGPAYSPEHVIESGKILLGIDPVFTDYRGWQIIENQRKIAGLFSLREENREPVYIKTAARVGLGVLSSKCKKIMVES